MPGKGMEPQPERSAHLCVNLLCTQRVWASTSCALGEIEGGQVVRDTMGGEELVSHDGEAVPAVEGLRVHVPDATPQ
jgi:hypothetical protein